MCNRNRCIHSVIHIHHKYCPRGGGALVMQVQWFGFFSAGFLFHFVLLSPVGGEVFYNL